MSGWRDVLPRPVVAATALVLLPLGVAAQDAGFPIPIDPAFWDRAGRRFVIPDATASLAAGGATAFSREFPTNSPTGVTLTITVEPAAPGVARVRITLSDRTATATTVEACLPAEPGERFFGLGARFGSLDLAGRVVENWVADQAGTWGSRTSYSPTPFLLSSRGYGLLLDGPAPATFDLRHEGRGCYRVRVRAPELRAYLIAGPHPQTVLERHAGLVGFPPLPPSWAFGVWKNLIGGEALVEWEVERLREAGVPIDAVWIYDAVDDRAGVGWPWPIFGPIRPGVYRELTRLIHRLHRRRLKVLGYLHPFLYPRSDAYATARAHGFLVKTPDGRPHVEPWTFTPRAYLDFSNPRATAWWQDRVCIALLELGFDGAMLDFGEGAPVRGRYAGGQPGEVMHNLYPVLYLRAAHEVGEAAKPGDAVFFARAGYSGSQPVTMARFPGDQVRSWDRDRGLPSLIPAMLSGGLSGWPYWGPDIAGFFDGDGADRGAEKALWMRWVQLGALSPTMRDMLGSQRDPVGVWTDKDTLAVFRAYARLHTALRPYLYRYAQLAHRRGLPILRPLFLNYPADSGAYAVDDEYLVGDDLLVAPVLAPAQTVRRLYLPADRWRDYWTGEAYYGPGWVTVAAPLGQIPLFVREGGELSLPRPEELAFPVVSATAGPARGPSR